MPRQTSEKAVTSKNTRLQGKRMSTADTTQNLAPQKLKLLVTIVGRSKAEFFMDLLQSMEINVQLSMLGHGTATTETLRLLGLSDSDKAIIFSVLREERVRETLALLDEKFRTVRGGKGIAYTIPMTSVIGVATYRFLTNNRTPVREEQ